MKQNSLDRENRNRGNHFTPSGSSHPQHGTKHWANKLSEEQVLQIKEQIRIGDSPVDIAKRFNVSSGLITNIKHGRKWAWLN
jgi:hypothetical protein